MDASMIFKNMLKILLICWIVSCVSVPQSAALVLTPEQEAALQAKADKVSELREWYNKKRQTLKIKHPTAEETRLIEAAKKEWDEKSRTMTAREYDNAYEEWQKSTKAAWLSLDPATSSDADVIAADSESYVWNEIDDYAGDLEGQVKKDSKKEPEEDTGGEPEKFDEIPVDMTPTNQNTNVQTVQADQSTSSETITPQATANVTQTVTINDNGNITQETNTGMVKPAAGGIETPTNNSGTQKPEDTKPAEETKPADNNTKKEETTEPVAKYTGMYNDRQMIPDVMAVYCAMNAEDVVKDMSRLEGCIRKYVTEMNNANASDAQEGKKDYNRLRYAAMIDLFTIGIKKAAAVNGYEDAMNNYAESSANAGTEFDAEAVASNTMAFSTDVQNSVRELAGEVLKLEAINGFGNVDPSAIGEEEKSDKAKSVEEYAAQTNSETTQVDTLVEIGSEEEEIDADGGELDEVVVTGNSNAKEYISKFREMSDSRLAQQRAQYESIINDPTASDEMKKEAENILRYVEYIEEERNGSAEEPAPQNNTPPATESPAASQETPKAAPVDESDPVARDLAGRSDSDLNELYQDVKRDQEELSTTIFKMKQIKEKWQKQGKWTETEEKQLSQKMFEYKEMQEYQKSIEKEIKRRGK